MLTAEAGREGTLLVRVVQGDLGGEDVLHEEHETTQHLGQEELAGVTLDLLRERGRLPVLGAGAG